MSTLTKSVSPRHSFFWQSRRRCRRSQLRRSIVEPLESRRLLTTITELVQEAVFPSPSFGVSMNDHGESVVFGYPEYPWTGGDSAPYAARFDATHHRTGPLVRIPVDYITDHSFSNAGNILACSGGSDPGWGYTLVSDSGAIIESGRYSSASVIEPLCDFAPDGSFVITWYEDGQQWAQQYSESGRLENGPIHVGAFRATDIDVGSDNSFVVAGTSGKMTNAIKYGASGDAVTDTLIANTHQGTVKALAGVALDGQGGFVVAWNSLNQDGTFSSIYSQRFDSAGNKVGTETRLTPANSETQQLASIDMFQSGRFAISYTESDSPFPPTTYLQTFSADVQPETERIEVHFTGGFSQVAVDTDHSIVVEHYSNYFPTPTGYQTTAYFYFANNSPVVTVTDVFSGAEGIPIALDCSGQLRRRRRPDAIPLGLRWRWELGYRILE